MLTFYTEGSCCVQRLLINFINNITNRSQAYHQHLRKKFEKQMWSSFVALALVPHVSDQLATGTVNIIKQSTSCAQFSSTMGLDN